MPRKAKGVKRIIKEEKRFFEKEKQGKKYRKLIHKKLKHLKDIEILED